MEKNFKVIHCRICGRKMIVSNEAITGVCWKCCMKKSRLKKAFLDRRQEVKKVAIIVE